MVTISAYKATTSIPHIWPTFSATETTPAIITLSLLPTALVPTIFSIIDEIILSHKDVPKGFESQHQGDLMKYLGVKIVNHDNRYTLIQEFLIQ